MYPGNGFVKCPRQPAFIMAKTGEAVTYAELEARSNRLAHLLRAQGLCGLDHYAIFMENNARYIESCSAGSRAGLYYTCVNSFLTPDELAYILNNSESKILITSEAKRGVAMAALALATVATCCGRHSSPVLRVRTTVAPPGPVRWRLTWRPCSASPQSM